MSMVIMIQDTTTLQFSARRATFQLWHATPTHAAQTDFSPGVSSTYSAITSGRPSRSSPGMYYNVWAAAPLSRYFMPPLSVPGSSTWRWTLKKIGPRLSRALNARQTSFRLEATSGCCLFLPTIELIGLSYFEYVIDTKYTGALMYEPWM